MKKQHTGHALPYNVCLPLLKKLWCGCIVLLGVVLLFCVQPAPVFAHAAHAILLHSNPQDGSVLTTPPTTIQLWFSEPVQIVGQAVTVLAPSGKTSIRGPVRADGANLSVYIDATSEGTYLVTWQVISQDTDPASGLFTFSVKHTGGMWATTVSQESVSPLGLFLQVVARWLHFLGYALGFGVLAFRQLVLRPLTLEQHEMVEQRIWRLVRIGILVLVCAEPVALLAQVVSLGAAVWLDPNILATLLTSSFGRVLAQRLGAAILLWILVGVARDDAKYTNKAVTGALALGLALAVVDSEASHAVVSTPLWLALCATALHVAAMGAWIGGLIALLSSISIQELHVHRNEIVLRFSGLALAAVVELAATGIVMAYVRLPQLSALFTNAYGIVLTAKSSVLLFVIVLVLIGRRAHRVYQQRWWLVEVLVLTGILILAGLLVSLPPPA